MWKVAKPAYLAGETLHLCASKLKDADLRRRIHSATGQVEDACDRYEAAAAGVSFDSLKKADFKVPHVTDDEMVKLYDNSMVKKNSPGQRTYDALKNAAPHGRCPLCGVGTVTTLDHQLPKRKFSALAVTPSNLVPACKDCNHAKSSGVPTSPDKHTMHPYFDDVEAMQWLSANVVPGAPAAVKFQVAVPTSCSPVLAARIQNHFDVFDLARRYSLHASNEASTARHRLNDLHQRGGAAAVKAFVAETAFWLAPENLNDWRLATYSAFAASDWFCDGGFAAA